MTLGLALLYTLLVVIVSLQITYLEDDAAGSVVKDKVCNGDRPKVLFDKDGVTPVALTTAAGKYTSNHSLDQSSVGMSWINQAPECIFERLLMITGENPWTSTVPGLDSDQTFTLLRRLAVVA